jgi:hypothetical protein
MSKGDNDDLPELLRSLGFYQARINAELAKGTKADHDKIAAAYAAGRKFAPWMPRSIATQNRRAGGGDRPPEAAETRSGSPASLRGSAETSASHSGLIRPVPNSTLC